MRENPGKARDLLGRIESLIQVFQEFFNIGRQGTRLRPFLLLVVGHPSPDARVPVIRKKSLEEVTSFVSG